MIIKPAGDGKSVLAELESLRNSADRKRRRQIEEEIHIVRAGQKGESKSAYLVDFDFAKAISMCARARPGQVTKMRLAARPLTSNGSRPVSDRRLNTLSTS